MKRVSRGGSVLALLFLIVCSAAHASGSAAQWLQQWYSEYGIGGGWRVDRVRNDGGGAVVRVAVPTLQAWGLMELDPGQQLRIIAGTACPSRLEKAWSLMSAKADITIQPTLKGEVFSDVSCRRWGQ